MKRLLKKSKQQIPRGLKAARDDKKEELVTAHLQVRPFKTARTRVLQRPVKSCPDRNMTYAHF
jgi:hypothetical protein